MEKEKPCAVPKGEHPITWEGLWGWTLAVIFVAIILWTIGIALWDMAHWEYYISHPAPFADGHELECNISKPLTVLPNGEVVTHEVLTCVNEGGTSTYYGVAK